MRVLAILLAAALLAACRSAPTNTAKAGMAEETDDERLLEDIGGAYWDALLSTTTLQALNQNGIGYLGGPMYATSIGDHRFDDRLDDLSPEAHAKLLSTLGQLRAVLGRVRPGSLDDDERISWETLAAQLDDAQAVEVCKVDLWNLDPQNGPQVQLGQTALYYPLDTPESAAALAARYAQAGRYFDQVIANLRQGLAQGLVAPRANAVKVLDQLDGFVQRGGAELLPPAERFGKLIAPDAARAMVARSIREDVVPAAAKLRDFLRGELLPKARGDDRIGLWALPLGSACYDTLARHHTGTPRTAQELHDTGLAQLEKIEAEARQIAGKRSLVELRAELAKRPDQFKKSGAELLEWNKALLARATAALPGAFSKLSLRPIEIRPVEEYRAPAFPVGYYQPPPDDGSMPAIYYVNTYRPETRALYNNEALLFHEAVPGHHLQGSLMLDLKAPEYRRQFGPTAYIEGWALYSERMSDEVLHLYSGPPARFGMLGYQAWRAARLVVDTGMHALRWNREQCIRFLQDHTTLPRGEAENEIDRYAAQPGQALGYMVGRLEIERLRDETKKRLGSRFDLKAFHDAVLRHGPVSMATLERLVGKL